MLSSQECSTQSPTESLVRRRSRRSASLRLARDNRAVYPTSKMVSLRTREPVARARVLLPLRTCACVRLTFRPRARALENSTPELAPPYAPFLWLGDLRLG